MTIWLLQDTNWEDLQIPESSAFRLQEKSIWNKEYAVKNKKAASASVDKADPRQPGNY